MRLRWIAMTSACLLACGKHDEPTKSVPAEAAVPTDPVDLAMTRKAPGGELLSVGGWGLCDLLAHGPDAATRAEIQQRVDAMQVAGDDVLSGVQLAHGFAGGTAGSSCDELAQLAYRVEGQYDSLSESLGGGRHSGTPELRMRAFWATALAARLAPPPPAVDPVPDAGIVPAPLAHGKGKLPHGR